MKRQSDSKKRIAFPIQLFDENTGSSIALPDVIHIVPTGTWDHPAFGKFTIGTAEIAKFVANFKAGIRNDLPITAGHDNGMSGGELPAVGWFTELIDRGMNGLYGAVTWTPEGQELLTNGSFKYFSAELYMQYKDPETGDEYECVLVGGALTNQPYFKELEPVVAFSEKSVFSQFNHSESNMDLNTILAKKPEELNDDEKAFVKEHEAELTDEQKTSFASALEVTTEETPEEKAAREEKEKGDANEAAGLNRDGSAKVSASEKGVVKISATELSVLRNQADKGAKALEKIEASERSAIADKLTFSQTNSAGHFLPKQRSALLGFLTTLSEKQRDQFVTLVNAMPKPEIFGEIGDGGREIRNGTGDIAKEVDGKVREKMTASETAGKKMRYSEALRVVLAENPELSKRYNESIADEG